MRKILGIAILSIPFICVFVAGVIAGGIWTTLIAVSIAAILSGLIAIGVRVLLGVK